jgi:flagellar M-ring protein FliF
MNQSADLISTLIARFPFLEKVRTVPKPLLLGAAAMLVALIAAAALWTREADYKVLFSNLDDRDGGAIVTALGTMNVPYQFGPNGATILVPVDRVYDARLQLASQGLPRGGAAGFELLDQSRFGASQFSEQITYQRALEGELARSIEAVNAVRTARVHLALPRQSLFVRERQAPTASVLLNLYPGRSMSDAQVAAISWLLASSVTGLTAEKISIVDQNGRLLSAPPGDGRGMDAGQTRFVREAEQRTVERIMAILNPLVGLGNVHAQASVDADFSLREETSEVYRPNQQPGQESVRSKQNSDSLQSGAGAVKGVPGALSNQPPGETQAPIINPATPVTAPNAGTNAASSPAGPSQTRSDNTINYEVDRTISHVKQPVGAIKRISVAVVVNYQRDKEGEFQPIPPEDLTKLNDLVREAMGFSEARGDSLNLVNSQFNDADPAITWWRDPEIIALAKSALYWLVFGLAALWFYRKMVRPLWDRYINPTIDPVIAEIERAEAQREAVDSARSAAIERHEENLRLAREMAGKDPRAVSMVLRTWMSNDGK